MAHAHHTVAQSCLSHSYLYHTVYIHIHTHTYTFMHIHTHTYEYIPSLPWECSWHLLWPLVSKYCHSAVFDTWYMIFHKLYDISQTIWHFTNDVWEINGWTSTMLVIYMPVYSICLFIHYACLYVLTISWVLMSAPLWMRPIAVSTWSLLQA
jgi:hypothetical protein